MVAPGLPPLVGEPMDRAVRVWDPTQDFDPREHTSPEQYAVWCVKYGEWLVLAKKQGNGLTIATCGFPAHLPLPFPLGT